MFKISIVPDTNVLLSHLDLIKQLYITKFPFLFTLSFSKTVLSELDSLKKDKIDARNAIRFIESILESLKTEIEGRIDDRRIDVVVEAREAITPTNNDDKILNYCFQLENPILLTSDKILHLKCKSANIKSIQTSNVKAKDIASLILKEFEINDSVILYEENEEKMDKLKRIIEITIQPTITGILKSEIGTKYEVKIPKNSNLENYLEVVKKNFKLFKNFLPKNALKIIDEFLSAIENNNFQKAYDLSHPICMVFRQAFPSNVFN